MARSTPPSYDRKIVAIDFDGTIAPWGPLFKQDPPAPGVAEAVHALREAGYKIVVMTSRMSYEWWAYEVAHRHKGQYTGPEHFGRINERYVRKYLRDNGIEFDKITAEKVQARVYFDDRAWRTTPGELANDLTELLENSRMGGVDV